MIKDKNVDPAANIATSKLASDSGLGAGNLASSAVTAAKIASSAIIDRHLSANLRTGQIHLDLFTARGITGAELAVGPLSSATVPTLNVTSSAAGGQTAVIGWSSGSGSTAGIQFAPVWTPADYSSNSTITLEILALRTSTVDTGPLFATTIWQHGSGSTADSTGNLTVTSTALSTVSRSTFGIPGGVWTVRLVPASTADPLRLAGARILYDRQSTA